MPSALYGIEAWGIRSAKRRKVNLLEMKGLRRLVIVSRMDRVSNEKVCRRVGIERKLVSRVDQRVLDGLGTWKEWMSSVWPEGCRWQVNGGRVRGRPRLGWMDGVKMALGYREVMVEAA